MVPNSMKDRNSDTNRLSSKMGIRDYSNGVVIFLIVLGSLGMSIGEENPAGFLSIDCGSCLPKPDPVTNLTWVSDDKYILTGSKGSIPQVNATLDNYQALSTFRYFTESRSKFCYELPITFSDISLLLRASFLHGNANELKLPTAFDVFVNATNWTRIMWYSNEHLTQPIVRESIFFIPLGTVETDVCLVPVEGVPFISSFELRYLDQAGIMYAESFEYHTREQLFFTMLMRQNVGVEAGTPTLRYPTDQYDRFWTYASPEFVTGQSKNKTSLSGPNRNFSPSTNAVPAAVMDSAWVSPGGGNGVGSSHEDGYNQILGNTGSASLVYVIFYVAQLNATEPEISVNITLDVQTLAPFNINATPAVESAFHVLNTNSIDMQFSVPYVLNALEVYEQHSVVSPRTVSGQVDVINLFKTVYNKTDWQGDPCLPVPYNWLECNQSSFFGSVVVGITSIKLSILYDSKKLQHSNLSVKWLSSFDSLNTVSMTYSNIDADVFKYLLNDWLRTNLIRAMNFSNNIITALPDPGDGAPAIQFPKYPYTVLTTLDLSYNQLSEIVHLTHIFSPSNLEFLDLSHNRIRGQFLNTSGFTNFRSLEVLNISNNFFQGAVPASLSLSNLPDLNFLDISNNEFSGELDSSLFFKSLWTNSPFKQLNASSNLLNGVLDLTAWFQSLQEAAQDPIKLSDSGVKISNQLFILTNNNITSIVPMAERFDSALMILVHKPFFNNSGVLLGGNPYCAEQHQFAQRYLCRFNVDDIVHDHQRKHNNNAIIIGSVVGSVIILVVFSIGLLIIWRLQRQNFHYKQIQEEMARRRVHPPYFPYRDLKIATRDFHDSNKLGSGTFGAVHMGKLVDGTTIAVKRLFHGRKPQVLDEFLNEVVLITGIKHKNLLQLKGCCIENQERILVYEYAENGNLIDALWGETTKIQALGWRDRLNICIGIARGLSYLHEELHPRIIHRDIKPANVLLDQHLNAKIADFGTARTFMDNDQNAHFTKKIAGTRGYFAPEYFMEGRVSTKADVYSFGVMALEIISGNRWHKVRLDDDEGNLRTWAKNLQRNGALVDLLDPALRSDIDANENEVTRLINIALMCVRIDPDLRPTMSEVENMLLEGKERGYEELNSAFEEDYRALDLFHTAIETESGTSTSDTDLSTFSKLQSRTFVQLHSSTSANEMAKSDWRSLSMPREAEPKRLVKSVSMQLQRAEPDKLPLMEGENYG